MENTVKSSVLHNELIEWKSDVDLFNIEVKTFVKLMTGVKEKNNTKEFADLIEEQQQRMNLLIGESIEMKNSIQIREHELASKSLDSNQDDIMIEDDTELREDFQFFRNDIVEFKRNFHNFIIEWV